LIVRRHLFGPGPTNPYPEATEALARPLLGHLDPVFLEIMDETCARLREVWGTAANRTLPLSATGSAGMEAAFVNAVHPGDVVVVAVNGLFGQRMCEVASRCGAEVVPVEHEWGTPVDPERVLSAHPSPAIVAAVHAETSTGVRSDIAALGRAVHEAGDALLLVDAVTSIGGIELRADDWGIDIGYAGTQKCLGVGSSGRGRGTSTSARSAGTSATPAATRRPGPTTTPHPSRWSRRCTRRSAGSWRRGSRTSGRGTRPPGRSSRAASRRWGSSCSRRPARGCRS